MKSQAEILQIINSFHELGETAQAGEFLIREFGLEQPNFKGFEYREAAKPDFILMTTEGTFGEPQIIRLPENAFEFPFEMIMNLIAHEMVHVIQKSKEHMVMDKNEREWQAYYEMLFHKIFPKIPECSNFHKKFFGEKALDYYKRMGEGSELQQKYASQKLEVENLVASLL
ncbi:hypothetical protein LZZ90_11865 [Flavobacterium sp. SM15]|uniref:hypothetical protein n=1 Tax=Flavobacterium sp. SM15 TaxID=2908005 RepID=UPI001EDBA000|nr:hypothetical protein [Flavobacterium sp. SM15]MCG2612203.1 hypothetical protein [Flavobacterium sp. SM15]